MTNPRDIYRDLCLISGIIWTAGSAGLLVWMACRVGLPV